MKFDALRNSFDRLIRFLSVPRRTRGAAAIRMVLAATTLANMLSHLKEWRYLWGNDGVLPFATFRDFSHMRHALSLYTLSSSNRYEYVVFGLGLIVTSLYLVGWKTRITSVLFYVFTWSLYQRNPFVLDGGDNLLYLFAFFLMFVQSDWYLAVDQRQPKEGSYLPAIVHNFAIAAMVLQLMVLYASSGIAKATGPLWQNGTALYYVLQTDEFNMSHWSSLIWRSTPLVTALTYSTILYQVSWPFLIWYRSTKFAMVVGAFMMHVAIAFFMGLTWFSLIMIGAEAIIFADEDVLFYWGLFSAGLRQGRVFLSQGARAGRALLLPPVAALLNREAEG